MSTDTAAPAPEAHFDTGSRERSLESVALGIGTIAFIVTALVALVVFRLEPTPISGPGSVGQFSAICAGVAAILAFAAGRFVLHVRTAEPALRPLDYVDIAALALAHGVIALLSWVLLADILERGFIDAEVFGFPTIALAAAAAAVTAYVAFHSSTQMNLQLLAIVLAVFLVEGVIASTLTASDPHWWKENLSALGMTDDLSALAFNLTLIIAGFLVTVLARFATRDIPTTHPTGARNARISLILIGILLACVGIFPVDEFFAVHNSVACGMVVVFLVLIARLHVWFPGMARAFVMLGWVFVGVIVLLAVFFAVQFYTLTAVELVAGILIFTWIILFMRNTAALVKDTGGA